MVIWLNYSKWLKPKEYAIWIVFLILADRTIGHAFGTLCPLSVIVVSLTFCIVAKWYVLASEHAKQQLKINQT